MLTNSNWSENTSQFSWMANVSATVFRSTQAAAQCCVSVNFIRLLLSRSSCNIVRQPNTSDNESKMVVATMFSYCSQFVASWFVLLFRTLCARTSLPGPARSIHSKASHFVVATKSVVWSHVGRTRSAVVGRVRVSEPRVFDSTRLFVGSNQTERERERTIN